MYVRYRTLLLTGAFCLGWSGFAVAQRPEEVDSLRRVAEQGPDRARAIALTKLAYIYRKTSLDSSHAYLKLAAEVADSAKYPEELAYLYRIAAVIYSEEGNYALSDAYSFRAEYIFQKMGLEEDVAITRLNRATNYEDQARFAESIDVSLRALEYFEKVNDARGIVAIYINVGYVYEQVGDYASALEYETRARELAEKEGIYRSVGTSSHNLANVYRKLGRYDEALVEYQRCLAIYDSLKLPGYAAEAWRDLGANYLAQDSLIRASTCINKSIEIFQSIGNEPEQGVSLLELGRLYGRRGMPKEAEVQFTMALQKARHHRDSHLEAKAQLALAENALLQGHYAVADRALERGLYLADSLSLLPSVADGYGLKAQLAAARGQYAQAYSWQQRQNWLNDSLHSAGLQDKVFQLQATYQHSREAAEIQRLEQENQIQQLQSARERSTWFVGIFVIAVVAGGVIGVQRYRYRKAREKELQQRAEQLKTQVEEKTAELVTQSEELLQANHELEAILQHLKETQQQLVQSEKMASLGTLTAGIAHEINNPINFISSSVIPLKERMDLLQEVRTRVEALVAPEHQEALQALYQQVELDAVMEEIQELTHAIALGADRTAGIVKGLRNFSRLDESSYKVINLEEAIESTLLLLQSQYKDRITIERSYEDMEGLSCYPSQLSQLLMNLLTNAIQAIPDRGEIRIRTQPVRIQGQPWVKLQVEDTGIGMSPEVQQHIFEPFFTTKEVGKGTGLGLSISYSIVEKHGGNISVESTPGQGATFTVLLPNNLPPSGVS